MATSTRYDLAVIGGGSAGLTATTIAARMGARVLLVDKTSLGGDCLHDGCVPSKALIASARLAHQMRRAAEFGLGAVDVKIDLAAVMARIRGIQAEIGHHDSPEAMRALGADVMFGGARFVDAFTIEVGGATRVTADRFVIATGSRAAAPPIAGLSAAGYINHVSVFKLEALPARIAVLGGGPIGVEMGQALARLGAQVTILQSAPRLLEREEPEVSTHLQQVFAREGIVVHTGTRVERVSAGPGGKLLEYAAGDGKRGEVRADEVFVAVGRRPTLEGLGLENAGVRVNARGIEVDDRLRTSQKHIWAAGDCAGGPQFTHWAEYEARVATRNALFYGSERRALGAVPWVTFTDPEVARVGATLAQARERDPEAHAHRWDFARLDRALTEGEPGGFAQVVVDKRERVLGAHIIGHNAGEALGEWVTAIEQGAKLGSVGRTIHAYPTVSRINRRVGDTPFLDHGVSGWLLDVAARFKPRVRG